MKSCVKELKLRIYGRYTIQVEFFYWASASVVIVNIVAYNEVNGYHSSHICTLNNLVGQLPKWVTVDQMANSWTIGIERVGEMLKFFTDITGEEWVKWFEEDQKEGKWL